MRKVALKGLVWRRTRSVLTALAVVLGVAMVSGTYILTDTISRAFDGIFASSYKSTSAVVSGREVVKGSASGNAPVPASLLPRLRSLSGVQAAAGQIFDVNGSADTAKLLDKQGKTISRNAPTFGFGIDTSQPRFNPLKLKHGRWATGPREVVIDAETASHEHFGIGDRIGVSAQGPVGRFTITGIARFGSLNSLGGATIAVFDVPTAQKLLDKRGRFDTIALAAGPGVSASQLVREVRPLLPGSVQVRTGAQQARDNAKDTKEITRIFQYALLAFAAIALLVGSFVIFNTLSITVAQRVREFATLRTLGASRRQVLRSVLLEGLALGAVASVVGLFLGLLLAKGLSAVFTAFGLDLPKAGTVFAARTVIVSLAVGVVVTLLATISPARRATRVSPIAAAQEGARLPRSRLSRGAPTFALSVISVAVLALAVGALGGGLATGARLFAVGLGVVCLFAGVAMVSPRLVRPLASIVGAPARRIGGVAGRLASDNSVRSPGRTATTAAALMIGLALVTVVATLGQGLRNSDKDALRKQVRSDYVVTSKNGFDPFAAKAGDALAAAPGVRVASSVRSDRARVLGSTVTIVGVDPATIGKTFAFRWSKGSSATLPQLGRDGAIVQKSFAAKHHLSPGSRLVLTSPAGKRLQLRVRGVSAPPAFDKVDPVFGKVAISREAFDATFPSPKNLYTFVDTTGGATAANTGALERALAGYPDAKLRTREAWVTNRATGIDKLLNLLYVLLALSVIVSLFGMVNTLVLAVVERTRELGMLRAVGLTRRQARRMVRHESVITALIGAALGLPLGVFLAAVVTRALSEQGISFSVPIGLLVVFTLVAVVAGIVAAVFPARRAAELNVLKALQYE
jgi:putative ABC transport system permease protein